MRLYLYLLLLLTISTAAQASRIMLMPPLTFEQIAVDSNGLVSDPENAAKWIRKDNDDKDEVSEILRYSTSASVTDKSKGNPDEASTRSIEIYRNSNGLAKAVIMSSKLKYYKKEGHTPLPDAISTQIIKVGKDSKILTHTQCWNETDCFTLTSGLCKSIPKFTGVENLQALYDKLGACQNLSSGIDKVIDLQGQPYWDQHSENMHTLYTSKAVGKGKISQGWDQAIFGNAGRRKAFESKQLKNAVNGREMRIYDLVKACMYYQEKNSFDESATDLATPIEPAKAAN